jgi:hypothetical protein
MSNFTLRNCTFAYKCTQQWENLEETHEESVRFCNDCQKEVHYCEDDQELLVSIKLNRCVAFSRHETIHEMGLIVAPEYQKQEILPDETRSDILKKIMMLKSWFDENMDKELTRNEYNYIAERLLKQTGLEYSNRDLFGLQVWALKVPVLPGKWYREDSIKEGTHFDDNIIEFMESVGLNWNYWGTYAVNKGKKKTIK